MITPEKDSHGHQEELPVKETLHREIHETTEETERRLDAMWDRILDPNAPIEPVTKQDIIFDEDGRLLDGDSIDWAKVERNQLPLMHMPPMHILGVSEADVVADDEFHKSWDRITGVDVSPPGNVETEEDSEPTV